MWLHADIKNLPDIVRYRARVMPQKTALIEGNRRISFAELDTSSNRFACALEREDVRPGSVVAFVGKNSIEFFDVMFGGNKAGCTVLPLNWRLAAPELRAIIEDAQPAILFVAEEFMALMDGALQHVGRPCKVVPFASGRPDNGLADWYGADTAIDPGFPQDRSDIALLMYTSGTTGKPKGAEMAHRGLDYMRLCESLEPAFQWGDDDVLLMVMPNFHLLGASLPVQSLYNGSTVSILPVFEPGKLLHLIETDRPTVLVLAPTVIQMILDHPDAASTDFSAVRLTMYAGSPISAQLLKRAMLEMKCDFMQFYGATETLGALTILRPHQHDLQQEGKLRSCGTPLPLIELRVSDGSGVEVPDGEIGEFHVRSPALFVGYRNQPDTTAAVLRDGWYRTGDAGYRDKDGLLYIVDRIKDMIVTGGENVYSAEVEQALQKHPAVAMSAVVGAPDTRWGERVAAFVVLKKGSSATTEDLEQHCRSLIAGFKVPRQIEFMDALPISAAGKVLKRVLRDGLWQGRGRSVG